MGSIPIGSISADAPQAAARERCQHARASALPWRGSPVGGRCRRCCLSLRSRLGLFCFERRRMTRVAQQRDLPDRIDLHVGCRLGNTVEDETHAVALVEPHSSVQGDDLEERWEPGAPPVRFTDLYGNVCRRLDLHGRERRLRLRRDRAHLARARGDAGRATTSSTASRSCRPSSCTGSCRAGCASPTRSATPPGSSSARRRAAPRACRRVCDWIHENVAYGVAERPDDDGRARSSSAGAACAATSRTSA